MWNTWRPTIVCKVGAAERFGVVEEVTPLGALRRLETRDDERVDFAPASAGQVAAPQRQFYPLWAVFSGLVIYCAVFWALISMVGSWGIEFVRTAVAATN